MVLNFLGIEFLNSLMKGLKQFAEWLVARKLSYKTIQQYLLHYKIFEREIGEDLNQNNINNFVIKHSSNISRSFLKNLFDFYNLKEFDVPKIRGRKVKKIRKSISAEDLKALRNYLYKKSNYKYGLMLDLAYYCALRREEVVKIALIDFEFKKWSADPSKACRLKIHGKGSKERPVIVPPKLMMRITKWIKRKQDLSSRGRLFGMGEHRWHEVFKNAVKGSGLTYNYTLHDLRRSKGTEWINKLGINSAKNRLGHALISTTQLYHNRDEEQEMQDWEGEY